jgi:hypothetical protein
MNRHYPAVFPILLATAAFSRQFEVASIKPNRTAAGEGAPREKITATPETWNFTGPKHGAGNKVPQTGNSVSEINH